jgi:predicted aminopeptidase
MTRRTALFIAGAGILGSLGSCSTVGFYAQALQGQMEVFDKARPVDIVKADPTTKPALKDRLEVVERMLSFAEKDLRLPAKDQYRRYTDLNRPYVVWVVYAAPEFSVEGKTWRYPFVGELEYRGFFKEELAEREAERWRKKGFDVFVGGVSAFSTLGVFRDPLLNTFIGRSEADLAELLFHELTHQRLYLSGDTDFNEALATVVGREGARRWLRSQGRAADLRKYEQGLRVENEFVQIALATREELRATYARSQSDDKAKRAAKAEILDRLKQNLMAMDRRHGGSLKMEHWLAKPVNNARLNTIATYHRMVPGFEAVLNRHQGDLEAFFEEVQDMRSLSKEERERKLLSPP